MSRSKSGTVWRCPKCDARVITHVPLTATPTCSKHAGKPPQMEQIK